MKFTTIIPGKLYQGAEFKSNLTADDKMSILDCQGIDVVINVYKNEDNLLAKCLHRYIYHPLSDGTKIDGTINIVAGTASGLIREGHTIFTHCHAGRNRSGFVNALIVMKVLRISGKDALEYVRMKRPGAIDNIYFEQYLLSL
jgi:protein-tyrosine phosphatase